MCSTLSLDDDLGRQMLLPAVSYQLCRKHYRDISFTSTCENKSDQQDERMDHLSIGPPAHICWGSQGSVYILDRREALTMQLIRNLPYSLLNMV